jgi:glycosyltransferase involved in cell wall biosynthesis
MSGVDLQRLLPLRSRATEVERRLNIEPGNLVFGFSGRWSEEKDPLAFVEIARRVNKDLPVRFVMTGTGPLRPAVERAVLEAKFEDGRFLVAGEVPDIASWIGSYDLLVVPSRLDGRPVVVMEALALGVPVLASRVGALPELIEEAATGWLCEPGDIDGFVDRIEALASGRVDHARMRANARAFAEEHLSLDTMVREYARVLLSLVDHGAATGSRAYAK